MTRHEITGAPQRVAPIRGGLCMPVHIHGRIPCRAPAPTALAGHGPSAASLPEPPEGGRMVV
ncbi:hypothetical protein DA2_3575 [Desulfovibrio sp. A2]|nr:hypothetical protein DA2_3575 [Desulfovibrio sp. A2]